MTHTNDPISNGRAPKSDRLNSGRFLVNVTANFITISLVLAALVAFLIGSAAHINLSSKLYSRPSLSTSPSNQPNHGGTTINKQTLLPRIGLCGDEGCYAEEGAEQILLASDAKYPSSKLGDEEKDNDAGIINYTYAPHLPSGQHLLVDARDVNSGFLNSDERIVTAMVGLTEECKIALLSYHCLSHVPVGVSCYGVSSEGHVSIRTWPEEGVIIIDLFKCGTSPPLIQVLPIIKKLFVIPSHDLVEESGGDLQEPTIIWSYKLRGFREGFYGYRRYDNPLETDLGLDLLRMHYLAMKEVLVSEETDFQHVDIYELINPRRTSMASYKRSLSGDGSYESLHPEIYRPDKILFLDGVQQSSLYGEAAYHEALVHPSMITHPNPRRVAIIGGGEGATLREVLKHNTVKEAVMVEIDGELVDMCRGHLIEWCDCTDLVGSDANLCFDDSRASVLIEDAFAWFIDNFGGSTKKREQFDVIIMDALDPDKFVEIVGELYKSDQFVRSLYNGLADEGVVSLQLMNMIKMPQLSRANTYIFPQFVVQIGESQHIDDTALEVGQLKDTAHMVSGNTPQSWFSVLCRIIVATN